MHDEKRSEACATSGTSDDVAKKVEPLEDTKRTWEQNATALPSPLESLDSVGQKIVLLKLVEMEPGISPNELTLRVLDSLYMDYFSYQDAYLTLTQEQLLMESVRKGELRKDAKGQLLPSIDLTPRGSEILQTLYPQLPLPIRRYLETTELKRQRDRGRMLHPHAHYEPHPSGRGFQCILSLNEGERTSLFDLRLTVPSQYLAENICRKFLEKPSELYLGLLELCQFED